MSETHTTDYRQEAIEDARETARNFLDEITEAYLSDGKASDNLDNDYPGGDAWHHEQHVDYDWRPREAIEILEQLDAHEETDSGLWEGLEWDRTLSTIAAFTYGNAVYHYWREIIEAVNENEDLADMKARRDDDGEGEGPGVMPVTEEEVKARILEVINAY